MRHFEPKPLTAAERCSTAARQSSSWPLSFGFSLVELLVASSIAAIVFAVAGSLVFSHLLDSRKIETSQRLREKSNRINYLLNIEGSEAREVIFDVNSFNSAEWSTCTAGESSPQPLFQLNVPRAVGLYGSNPPNDYRIYYYNSSAGDLVRCAPPVQQNGVLSDGSLQKGILSENTTMELITASSTESCGGEKTNNRQIAYNLVYRQSFTGLDKDRFSTYRPKCAVARARTIFVCNPDTATTSSGAIGQCVVSATSS
jgi:prepilin-type N-terminal cleavage/methylation domain-containing protein